MPRYITYQRRKCNTSTKEKFFLHCTYKWSVIFKWSHNIFPVNNKSWKKLILHNNYWSKQITNKPGLAHVPGDLHGFPNTKEILHKLLQTNQTMWNFTGNLVTKHHKNEIDQEIFYLWNMTELGFFSKHWKERGFIISNGIKYV